SPPERFHRALDPAEQCSGWRSHVLNKDELAAGSKHPLQFRKCPTLVDNATQNQCADSVINGGGPDRQFLRRSAPKFDPQTQTPRLFCQVPIHIRVRLYTDPADLLRREVSQVSSGARTDFQHPAGNVRKQSGLVRREVTVSLVAEPRHEPGENAQPDGTGAAADTRGIAFGAFSTQRIDYSAIRGRPP